MAPLHTSLGDRARLYLKKTEKRNKRGDIITNSMNIKRKIKLYAHRFDNLGEMDQFLKRHNLPNSPKRKDNLNCSVSIKGLNQPGTVAHALISAFWEAKAGRS